MHERTVFLRLYSCVQGQPCGPSEDSSEGTGYSIQRTGLVLDESVYLPHDALRVASAKAGRQARPPRIPAQQFVGHGDLRWAN